MPVEQETVLTITCDNPACPGNDLDPADRLGWTFVTAEVYGWTFVTAEVYGQPTTQHVYCSPGCAGTVGDALAAV